MEKFSDTAIAELEAMAQHINSAALAIFQIDESSNSENYWKMDRAIMDMLGSLRSERRQLARQLTTIRQWQADEPSVHFDAE
jgi:hypothetical protein